MVNNYGWTRTQFVYCTWDLGCTRSPRKIKFTQGNTIQVAQQNPFHEKKYSGSSPFYSWNLFRFVSNGLVSHGSGSQWKVMVYSPGRHRFLERKFRSVFPLSKLKILLWEMADSAVQIPLFTIRILEKCLQSCKIPHEPKLFPLEWTIQPFSHPLWWLSSPRRKIPPLFCTEIAKFRSENSVPLDFSQFGSPLRYSAKRNRLRPKPSL